MKNFPADVGVLKTAGPMFGVAGQPNKQGEAGGPEELTSAEIAVVAGGPEGEVGAGVTPPH